MNKKFTSFTGETIESALLIDEGPETWYDCLHAHQKTPEGKRGLWKNGIDWRYGITPDDYTN